MLAPESVLFSFQQWAKVKVKKGDPVGSHPDSESQKREAPARVHAASHAPALYSLKSQGGGNPSHAHG